MAPLMAAAAGAIAGGCVSGVVNWFARVARTLDPSRKQATWPPQAAAANKDFPAPPQHCDSMTDIGSCAGSPGLLTREPQNVLDAASIGSSDRFFALRIHPTQDLKSVLLAFVQEHGLKAAAVVTCVGSLRSAALRLANASAENPNCFLQRTEMFEICSLVGTLEAGGADQKPKCHLHISLADKDGCMVGGHVIDGCCINTTAEVVLVELADFSFSREMDVATGFPELLIQRRA